MHDDDVTAALERLESGAPRSDASRLAWEPATPLEAVRAWLAARGVKRGSFVASHAALRLSYEAHARDAGWALEALTVAAMGRAMRALGFIACCQSGVRGYRVDRDSARALNLLSPASKPRAASPHAGRRANRRPNARRRQPKVPFWPLRHGGAQPVTDTRGRVYPSAREAARCLRVAHVTVQRAAANGLGAAGCLWRYLTPDEVALVPADARAGDVVPALAWGRTVTVQCPTCRASSGAASADGHPPPSPQVSPTPPSMGPEARGVTHIP